MDTVLQEIKVLRRDIEKIKTLLCIENMYVHNFTQKIILKISKGSACSVNGKKYEDLCYNNIKHSSKILKLGGGSSHEADIHTTNGHIECKATQPPDWGQSQLKWEDGRWVPTNTFFQKYMDRVRFKPPPFLYNKISYDEWIKIKHAYKDEYLEIEDQGIQKFYTNKGCAYIQIKDYGLYHMGKDPLDLRVPEFLVKQRIRIRVKVHSKSKSKLSVTAAFQPINIKTLEPSEYSLDDSSRLPPNL